MKILDSLNEFMSSLFQRALVFSSPSNGLFIGYLLCAFIIAVLFYAYKSKSMNFFKVAIKVCKIYNITSRSPRDDFILFVFDKIFMGFIYSFIFGLVGYFYGGTINLLFLLGLPTSVYQPGIILSVIITIGSLIAFDFAVFIEHYLSHKILFLWEFHKIHHIAEELNPLTAYRTHPINQCCFVFMVSLFSGVYSGSIGYFFDSNQAYILMYGQNVFIFILLIFGLNLQHSRIFICYPKIVRKILISPAYHQLHHSSEKKHHDVNFGFIFSFWDKLFKTQLQPSDEGRLTFGVRGEKYENYSGIRKTYLVPFKKSFTRIKNIFRKFFSEFF